MYIFFVWKLWFVCVWGGGGVRVRARACVCTQ